MQSKLAAWCDGLIELAVLAAVVIAPLFFNIHSDRVFEPDKLTLVRSLALFMAAIWLVGFIDSQGWEDLDWLRWRSESSIWRMPFVLPVFLLVIVYLVSTLFSVVPRTSWSGSYQRLQGTYTTLSYIVIFALTANTFRRRAQINRLVTTIIVASIPVSLYGILQHYGLDPLPWGGNVQRRIAGHMGNAIFIAAYLIMAVPLTAVRIIDAFTNILGDEVLSYADVVRSSVYIFALAIQLVAIYWSGSRGPMLGLLVGLFALVLILLVALRNTATESGRFRVADLGRGLALVLVGMAASGAVIYAAIQIITGTGRLSNLTGPATSLTAFAGSLVVVAILIFVFMAMRRGWRWLWLSWLTLAIIGMLWLGVFNLAPGADEIQGPPATFSERVVQTVDAWRELPTVGRFGRLLEAESGTGRVRVLIWEGALELIQPHEPLVYPTGRTDSLNFLRPLIGYGPESMYVAYNRFYVPELATLEARNASPDRSHNETFDALIITGLLGFLTWQALYLSVFYFGFHWLGVVRSTRDRNLLIGFWIAGAIVGALVITQLLGIVYIGVAIPFGSIVGLALYLVYYALFGSTRAVTALHDEPFQADRLLLMGLVAAVLAHYVEIHFGIAIAATRVHFFVYVALMLLVGYVLPRVHEEAESAPETQSGSERQSSRRRRARWRRAGAQPSWLRPVLAATFALTVIIGTLAFEYINYNQPPGVTIESVADVPSTAEIVHQSFFVHPGQEFVDSPFIFLVIILSWILGALAYLSEMIRQGIIAAPASGRQSGVNKNRQTAGILFIVLMVAGLASRFLQSGSPTATATQALGQGLLLIWTALCLFAALLLFRKQDAEGTGERVAGYTAATGLALSIPLLVAGSTLMGFLLLLVCGAILYLLWDGSWTAQAGPVLVMSLTSIIIAFILSYVQASQIRTAVFFGPPQPLGEIQRLLFSADRFANFVTVYYAFVILLLLLAPFAVARGRAVLVSRASRRRRQNSLYGYAALAVVLVAALFLITTTNLRIIQADIIYKQGRPLDNQASSANDPQAWEAPIALYEHAIDLAPVEDFYYLFLGRAYLEQSAVATDPAVQQQLLETANQRLQEAQRINPLNTDHTANLARLSTRWASLNNIDEDRRGELVQQANDYYRDALALSPQNSVIRNEYGNMLATLNSDCEAGIETYERSLEIDPYYVQTYYGLAGVYELCAAEEEGEQQTEYYRRAASLLEQSLEQNTNNAGAVLLQTAQLYQQAEAYEEAVAALQEARDVEGGQTPSYLVDFRLAGVYRDMGDTARARTLASQALEGAPPESQEEIQTFLDQLAGS
ncbi:MAG: O-antigen ligase family protein [Chloroflexota bacterium]